MHSKLIALVALVAALISMGAKPAPYTVAPVDNGATVQGVVTFAGTAPASDKILISKDNEVCGTGNREIQWVSSGDDKGLQNVAVYIADIEQGKDWDKPKEGYFLNQEGCRFVSDFFAVPKGEELRVLNSDPILHNIHSYEIIGRARRTLFNVGQPEKGFEFTKLIRTRRSNVVKIECDAHNFMHAWVFAPENPYFALVGAKGGYKIEDVPAGTHTIKAWHPTLGEQEAEVTLEAGGKAALNFEFK